MAIRDVHYELTDLCNAGCPQCPRTDERGCKPQRWLLRGTCTLESFRRYSPHAFLQQVESADFCGNFGDAAVVPEFIDILRYCWEANPKLRLRLHTNASIRSVAWWEELAHAATGHSFLAVAGIDGVSQESNRRYRVRTDFARIMANLAAFIAAGGRAEWRMIVFRHNEHEVATAERIAKEMGFVGFRAYPSDRFNGKTAFRYTYDTEDFVLEPPTGSYRPKAPGIREIASHDLPKTEAVIECQAIGKSSAFIDFQGNLLPCCHIGRQLYLRDQSAPGRNAALIGDVFDTFDMRRLNVNAAGFDAARKAYDEFLAHLRPRWAEQRPAICKAICGKKRVLATTTCGAHPTMAPGTQNANKTPARANPTSAAVF